MKWNKVISVILSLVGIGGAVAALVILISAVKAAEWGRVVFYSVMMAIAVEMAILNISALKPDKTQE